MQDRFWKVIQGRLGLQLVVSACLLGLVALTLCWLGLGVRAKDLMT